MLATVGQRPAFDFPVKDHLQLGEELDLIDFETGGVVRGGGGGAAAVPAAAHSWASWAAWGG